MPRVAPSEFIALIDQHYSAFNARTLDVTHATVAGLMAIARLVDELPTELLSISSADYSDLVSGVEAIKNSVGFWQRKGAGQIGVSENTWQKCPLIDPRRSRQMFRPKPFASYSGFGVHIGP